jgi:hypothetical protein
MKAAFSVAGVVLGLMVWAVYDVGAAAERRALLQPSGVFFNCAAPKQEGESTLIYISVRDGVLVGDCNYAELRSRRRGTGKGARQ